MTALKDKLAPAPAVAERPKTIFDRIEGQREQIQRALPPGMSADRFARVVLNAVRDTPQLVTCSWESLLGAVMLCAQLGLEPGPSGHVYLVPRRRKGNWEVQFQLGYKGIIALAFDSERITSIEARVVREHDEFDYEYGFEPRLTHRPPRLGEDRGPSVGFYGIARYANGDRFFHVMAKSEVDRIRGLSDAGDSEWGPWVNHPDAMSCKTVIKQMAPYLPLPARMSAAIAQDETVHTELGEDMASRAIDAEAFEPDVEQAPADATPPPSVGAGDLPDLEFAELRDLAERLGVNVKGKNRPKLTAAVEAKLAEVESSPDPTGTPADVEGTTGGDGPEGHPAPGAPPDDAEAAE